MDVYILHNRNNFLHFQLYKAKPHFRSSWILIITIILTSQKIVRHGQLSHPRSSLQYSQRSP